MAILCYSQPMRCPICESETRVVVGSTAALYHSCVCCRFVFKDPSDRPDSEASRERYLLHDNNLKNRGYVAYLQRFIEQLDLTEKDLSTRILDFGSGPEPVLAWLLSQKGYIVDTYDLFFSPSEEYLSRRYDLITLLEVAEHLGDPVKVLGTLRGILKDTGRIVVRTQLNRTTDDRQFLSWWYTKDMTHIGFFSERSLQFLSEKIDMNMFLKDENTAVFFPKKG